MARKDGASLIGELKDSVLALIKENRKLKRQIVKLEGRRVPPPDGLASLARRVERALGTKTRRRRRQKVVS